MILAILLWWCGVKLSAPIWFFIFLGVEIVFKILLFGMRMYKLGVKHDAS